MLARCAIAPLEWGVTRPERLHIDPALIGAFAALVGTDHAIVDPVATQPFLIENRGRFVGQTPLVLQPASTAEVAAIMQLASRTGTAIVPQGGNTGLVGGQIPDRSGMQVVLSLRRLDRVRAIDPIAETMTVEAGVTLTAAGDAAASADRLFPLTLASGERASIGGVLSTNAGGTHVLTYGMARDLALGLEVVLPTGEIWNGLRRLRKDNAGYNLRDLFIGSEGTLGVITAAVLRVFPRPRGQAVAFVAVADPRAALALFSSARAALGPTLTAAEFMERTGLDFALRHQVGASDPFAEPHPWYVLLEVSSPRSDKDAESDLRAVVAAARESLAGSDAVLGTDAAARDRLWRLRYAMNEVQKYEGASIKHDVSLPLDRLPAFLERAGAAVREMIPGCRLCPFGHLGDGNVHFNVSQPVGADADAFLARWDEVNAVVHAIVTDFGGSVAAEHGIGQLKRDLLPTVKHAVEIDLMRRVKQAIDPQGIMNPGKILKYQANLVR